MLIAARSSKDFACCLLAIASARSKYASAFAASKARDSSTISPAIRWISASHQISLDALDAAIASPIQRLASSNWPSLAWTLAKNDMCNGVQHVAPVDRHAVTPAVIV